MIPCVFYRPENSKIRFWVVLSHNFKSKNIFQKTGGSQVVSMVLSIPWKFHVHTTTRSVRILIQMAKIRQNSDFSGGFER